MCLCLYVNFFLGIENAKKKERENAVSDLHQNDQESHFQFFKNYFIISTFWIWHTQNKVLITFFQKYKRK